MKPADMTRMANQIAAFFNAYPRDEAVAGIRTHIRDFWEPRMKRMLAEHIAVGGEGLSPLVVEAARDLAPAG
jgi:formate dehydrogenase subunit delta